jgi:hypothetical protein
MMIAGKQAGGQPTRRRWQYLHTQIETVIIDGWDGMEMHAMDQQQQWYCTVMMRERRPTSYHQSSSDQRFDECKAWMGWAKDGWLASFLLASSSKDQTRP